MKNKDTTLQWLSSKLDTLKRADLLRTLPPSIGMQGAMVQVEGQELVNFASNDYLSLAADKRLTTAAAEACLLHGVGRGASPLVIGRATVHEKLEERLAALEETEAALLFPTGYAANSGVIPALADRKDLILGDAKNHASIIDGCRLSRAEKQVYPHVDMAALENMLKQSMHFRRRLIVTDTLFSMDGDLAPLPQLAELADRYQAMLMVDDAHATGIFGRQGCGVHVRVGTLSKALGSAGGFVCGSRSLVDWVANRARSYVFSTAQPAAMSAAALVALDIIEEEPQRGKTVLGRAAELRTRLQSQGWNTGHSASQIVPIVVGSPAATMQLAGSLRNRGFLVPGIRPPSVPAGESLLRLSVCYDHTPAMLDDFTETMGRLRRAD